MESVAKLMRANDVEYWSLTDHDTISGWESAEKYAKSVGINFLHQGVRGLAREPWIVSGLDTYHPCLSSASAEGGMGICILIIRIVPYVSCTFVRKQSHTLGSDSGLVPHLAQVAINIKHNEHFVLSPIPPPVVVTTQSLSELGVTWIWLK